MYYIHKPQFLTFSVLHEAQESDIPTMVLEPYTSFGPFKFTDSRRECMHSSGNFPFVYKRSIYDNCSPKDPFITTMFYPELMMEINFDSKNERTSKDYYESHIEYITCDPNRMKIQYRDHIILPASLPELQRRINCVVSPNGTLASSESLGIIVNFSYCAKCNQMRSDSVEICASKKQFKKLCPYYEHEPQKGGMYRARR